MLSAEIRHSFLDYFQSRGHEIVPSASLLPDSPNLLFTNAGMNQFVPYFLGDRPAPFTRAVDAQKCIRAGGKHNDLEDVGFDTYHHTFFEMLGNWSFGDYFKKEAIEYAWELLTKVWKLPPNRLYATVYQPDSGEPASTDTEAHELWKKIFEAEGLDPAVHVIFGNKKDNFWMMGETGPCGPCSELHIDLTPEGNTLGKLVNQDSPWCIEIWNLVFIQFNAEEDGSFIDLPARHVDTGMGFERIAGILATTANLTDFTQAPSNYNSDLFTDLFTHLTAECGHEYARTLPEHPDKMSPVEMKDCAFRVIADHIRTLAFSIADGILPGNEGRNYVLRRILRRAILFGKRLTLPDGFFARLVDPLVKKMGAFYPELVKHRDVIEKVIRSEELAFEKTLDRGLQLFQEKVGELKKDNPLSQATTLSGDFAFNLYDTYGFPLDLTALLAREEGISVDTDGFEKSMEKQRKRGRSSQKKQTIKLANSAGKATRFDGFDVGKLKNFTTEIEDLLKVGDEVFLICKETPFYAEMGGQIGDTGMVQAGEKSYPITNTLRDSEGRFLHVLENNRPDLAVGTPVHLLVDQRRRACIQRHHSATHMIHWALREVLGTHIRQAGSLVTADHLRFDFTHYEGVSEDTIDQIEKLVNDRILQNLPVHWYEVPFNEKPGDVIAVFGEKYGSKVRVVDIGGFSKELCGGTHVAATGEIGLCKIISENGIAAGTRRIEAVCGESAYELAEANFNELHHMANRLGCKPQDIEKRLEALLSQRHDLEKEVRKLRQQQATDEMGELSRSTVQLANGLPAIVQIAKANDPAELRGMAAGMGKELADGIVILGAEFGEKISVVAYCSDTAQQKGFRAGDLIRRIMPRLGGKGGGKPDLAMGGAANKNQLEEEIDRFRSELAG